MNKKNILLASLLLFLSVSVQAQNVKINEIMYNFGFNLNSLESGNWVELYNTTNTAVVMDGWQVVFGNDTFTVSSHTLAPLSYINIVSKDTVFYTNFPGIPYLGPTGFGLDNGGNDPIRIFDAAGALVDEVIYDNNAPWPIAADGQGRSLALISPTLDNDLASSWSTSGLMGGTPGLANVNPCQGMIPNIVINEINYKSSQSSPSGDWVELHNTEAMMVNLSNWEFLDSDTSFVIPAGTSIPADGYLVIASDIVAFNSIFPSVTNVIPQSSGIGLSGNGEQMALINNTRCLVDHVKYNDSAPWPLAPDGTGPTLSLVGPSLDNNIAGNWQDSSGATGDVFGTPGVDNNIPDPCLAISVNAYITEINFDSDSVANGGDWIEIYNPNPNPIGIFNYTLNSTGDGYLIPLGTIINTLDYLVVAEDLPAFQALYPNVTNVVPVSSGVKLDNGGDLITLYNNFGCLIDSVHFDDKSPWPTGADGTGYTIETFATSKQGNDLGANWLTSADSLGTPGSQNNSQPCSAPVGAPVVFNVTNNNAFVSWTASPNAVSHEVDFKLLSGSTWTTVTVASPTSFVALTNLTACSDYEVRIRTICAAGPSSYTSAVAFTTTGCFVCTAAQNTFDFNITNNSAILTWDVLVGASSYSIFFKKTSDATYQSVANWPFPILVLFGIAPCESYDWYVVNNCGASSSPPSGVSTFTTVCKDGEESPLVYSDEINIYPIPTSDRLYISVDSQLEVQMMRIVDMNGKTIQDVSATNLQLEELDTSTLMNGMYMLQVWTSEGIQNKRFTIQR